MPKTGKIGGTPIWIQTRCCGDFEIIVGAIWVAIAIAIGLQVFRSSDLQVFRSSGLQVFRSSGLQVFRSAGLQIFRGSGLQFFKSSGLQVFKSSGMQVFRYSGIQIVRSSGLQAFRASGFRASGLSSLRILPTFRELKTQDSLSLSLAPDAFTRTSVHHIHDTYAKTIKKVTCWAHGHRGNHVLAGSQQ